MGFKRTGKHINKEVSLWQQGDIKIVINTEREGFAHASYRAHGTSVCDIGFRVDDATRTLQRAEALNVSLLRQPVGQGELMLPAIRSVGGGLMHFIDDKSGLSRVWKVEFERTEINPGKGVSLTGIDHIAQSMDYDEMLTWSLFYTSLFQLEKKPVIDIVDPGGIVRSQVISSPDATIRLTLNGADTSRTLAGKFVADRFSSAVQHIAFACDNIFGAGERLRALGFETLSMPANYYDDLQARFGLSEERKRQLQTSDVLYDEDAEGQYYQLYSMPYGDGFFFEIVQRKNGYQGYGAANAPCRTAALKRSVSSMVAVA